MSLSAPPLPIVRTVAELRAAVAGWRGQGERVAFVPTMGALHEGHLSLVRLGKARAARVIASVFVNPTQFAPTEDLARYPRQEAKDAALLAGAGCDLLFAPSAGEMYPDGFSTSVTVCGISDDLEGAFRPQMFGGVATVVAKLLIQADPDVALFGEKDFQQLLVIQRLARDLDLPVEILAGPTVREADGLAMSSRNAYLSPAERQTASGLNLILKKAAVRARAGEPVPIAEAAVEGALLAAGFDRVDYVAIRRAGDLSVIEGALEGEARILAAAWLGRTRLIDNLAV
jgi:pantoate--beta-alanine ligase